MSSANIIDPRQLAAMAHEDLACYSIAQWPQFERARHHELIISKLEAVERGEIKRLMIFQPPRHGKSLRGFLNSRARCGENLKLPNEAKIARRREIT